MIRTKTVTANATPVELSFSNVGVRAHYKIIISNTSANKHLLIGGSNVSLTNYGMRAEHDQDPLVIENIPYQDKIYAISEDPNSSITVAVMVIE
jgi:hypothetical protein